MSQHETTDTEMTVINVEIDADQLGALLLSEIFGYKTPGRQELHVWVDHISRAHGGSGDELYSVADGRLEFRLLTHPPATHGKVHGDQRCERCAKVMREAESADG